MSCPVFDRLSVTCSRNCSVPVDGAVKLVVAVVVEFSVTGVPEVCTH